MVQFGLWNRFTSVTAVFSIRWPTVWSLITRLPKTFYKMHSWPYGDIPPPILHKQAPLADHLRRVRRRSTLQEAPLEELELDETTAFPDVWEDVWRSVKSSQVRAALMKIPAEQRLVIELAYFQGWTHTEIAEGVQIPLGTVKARLRLGLIHLKHALEQVGMDET